MVVIIGAALCVCGHGWLEHAALTKTCQVEGCGCQVYHLTEVVE